MTIGYQTPGVYREDVILEPAPQLQTGVPGFLGFVKSESAALFTQPVLLNRNNDFDAHFQGHLAGGSYLAQAVHGFFTNGGARCYVAVAGLSSGGNTNAHVEAMEMALQALSPLTDLDLIAAPDAMLLLPDVEAVKRVQIQMLTHCLVQGNRFAILDALPTNATEVVEQRNQITQGLSQPVNGALYYPWLVLPELAKSPLTKTNSRMIPSSGHVAGIYARSDARAGVFKAPANEEVLGALDLCVGEPGKWKEVNINDQTQSVLNPAGINCLRAFPGRGIRVWGARALNSDQDWRYVNVCRLIVTLRRWIDMNMTWAPFEPNTPQLWVRIHRELTVYLTDLWRAGALAGRTTDEAFYIKCDSETNSPEVVEAGQVVTNIGLAPAAPSEFVIVRIVHQIGVEPR